MVRADLAEVSVQSTLRSRAVVPRATLKGCADPTRTLCRVSLNDRSWPKAE